MSTFFCQNCGASNDESSKFCAHCGSGLVIPANNANSSQSQTAQIQNQPYGYNNNSYQNSQNYYNQSYANSMYHISPNALATFVGPDNTGYYMQKYSEMNMSNSKASWNWAAFLIAAPWMLYRKMYNNALIFFGCFLFMSFLLPYFSIALPILSGIFGNHFYFKFAEKKLKNTSIIYDYKNNIFISKQGGTSLGAALGITLAFMSIEFLIFVFIFTVGYGY